ncbi:hypothetical protein AB0758_30890 [Tolypothrix bouteillei VB521301_2]|uniref:hypothetical protein n=1 Tax=Tolypothrix bouteillei TaxID=1246981 RepID=UPI0038B42B31
MLIFLYTSVVLQNSYILKAPAVVLVETKEDLKASLRQYLAEMVAGSAFVKKQQPYFNNLRNCKAKVVQFGDFSS